MPAGRLGTGAASALAISTALAAHAAAEPLSLEYRSYLLGMPIASASATIELVGERYRVRGQVQSGGIASLFSSWQQEAISAGQLKAAGEILAERHWQNGTYRGEPRHIDLTYSSERAIVTSAAPDPEEREPEERVPPELTAGTTDALSGLLAMARRVGEGRGCEATMPVFDGRRRYDVTFRESETGGQVIEGATECRFLVNQIAGFKKKNGPATDPERPGRIWFRAAAPGRPAIPVRLEVDTDWGTAVVELVRVSQGREAAPVEG